MKNLRTKIKINILKSFVSNLLFLLSLLLSLSLITSCNTTEPPPVNKISSTITLKTDWQDLQRIEVNWNISENDKENNYKYQLVRVDESGKEFIKNFYITGSDTNYIDDNDGDSLKIGTKYIYKVEAYNSSNELKDTSNSLYTST
ncbi:MAG: hypothetical protein GXO85_04795, partial [Chlorobi bacterium]|nr:hypothetical protein [Chlorobiota bacterium]